MFRFYFRTLFISRPHLSYLVWMYPSFFLSPALRIVTKPCCANPHPLFRSWATFYIWPFREREFPEYIRKQASTWQWLEILGLPLLKARLSLKPPCAFFLSSIKWVNTTIGPNVQCLKAEVGLEHDIFFSDVFCSSACGHGVSNIGFKHVPKKKPWVFLFHGLWTQAILSILKKKVQIHRDFFLGPAFFPIKYEDHINLVFFV